MGWHAIFVETGKEDIVHTQISKLLEHLGYTDYELLIPKRRLKEKHQGKFIEIVKKMFPGYILIRADDPWNVFHKTRRFEHLYRFLNHDQQMLEIRLEEIANIIYMVDEEGVIGISDIYVKDDRIVVTKGPLMHYDGLVKKVDRRNHRVKVLFMFNGERHYIDISVNLIEKYRDVSGKEIPFFANYYFMDMSETKKDNINTYVT